MQSYPRSTDREQKLKSAWLQRQNFDYDIISLTSSFLLVSSNKSAYESKT